MAGPDSADASSNFDLHATLRRQSWAKLGPVVQRLHLALEVIDAEGVLGPAVFTTAGATSLRETLATANAPELRAALTSALRDNQRQRVSAGGIDLLLVPLNVRDTAVGAVVVARDLPSHAPLSDSRSDAEMDAAASWLAREIEAQLDVPLAGNQDADAFDRVSSLHRLLHEAVERGIERDVLVAFAEALLAWDDIEVRAYVEDIRGRLVLAIATPGIDRSEAATVPAMAAGVEPGLTRLPFADARFGFRRDKDVLTARIGGGPSQPWLLVFSGAIGADDESQLALYLDLLRQAVVRVGTIAETRMSWAILQHLLTTTDSVEETGQMALAELTRAVESLGSAIVVTASNGVHTLSIMDGAAFSTARPSGDFEEILSTLHVFDGYTMVLAVRRAQGHDFTRREQQIVDRAATTFAAWLPGVMTRLPQAQERRTENRGFDQVLNRVAVQNIADGLDVVVLVVATPAALSRPGLLHRWVAEIRGQLRASDLAGALSDHEMGILLSGTTTDHLMVVRTRILRRITLPEPGGTPPVSIGVASSPGGSVVETSLVDVARQDAARRSPGSERR